MKTIQVYLLRGIPYSGKSTKAKELLNGVQKIVWINRDNLRQSFFNREKISPKEEKILDSIIKDSILNYTSRGYDIILDAQHISLKSIAKYEAIFLKAKQNTALNFSFILIDFSEVKLSSCLKRSNEDSSKHVSDEYIKKQYKKILNIGNKWYDYYANFITNVNKYDPNKLFDQSDIKKNKAVIFDLDGTLALLKRSPYDQSDAILSDEPNIPIRDLLMMFYQKNYGIIIITGRYDKAREHTKKWLLTNNIPYDLLLMRANDDNRSDDIVKREIYEIISYTYDVSMVFDDRESVIEMWRNSNVFALQTNWGKF